MFPITQTMQLVEPALSWLNSFVVQTPPRTAILVAISTTLGIALISSFRILRTIIRPFFSPLRSLKTPPPPSSKFFGHLADTRKQLPGVWQHDQIKKYGHVFVYKAFLNTDRLITTDTKALHHILTNYTIYQKPAEIRYNLERLLGAGLLFVEGNVHKRQRRIMNPSFGPLHIREMTEIFVTKSLELNDKLHAIIDHFGPDAKSNTGDWTNVEILSILSCTTLDIIGLAGFNYSFDALASLPLSSKDRSLLSQDEFLKGGHSNSHGDGNELATAFSHLLNSAERPPLLSVLKMWFPIFRLIQFDARSRIQSKGAKTMKRIGRQLVEEKKKALLQADLNGNEEGKKAKDLLTLLIKANLSDGGAYGDRQLSDEEVMNQIPTFLVAGHETTSTSTTWALFSLSNNPDVQSKLRQELLAVETDNPTMDELNALPYLDRVIRETLRFHSVVPSTVRIATQEDFIPVEKPYEDRFGNVKNTIHVAEGDAIIIPVRALNTLEEFWGPDAKVFNPDRWLDIPKETASMPNIWSNQISFLAGPRSCIGYRFAIVEMKALLFSLIRSFEFELAVPPEQIVSKQAIVARPALVTEPHKGNQLPLHIKRVKSP